MFLSGRTRTIILSSAILLTGVIHLGVGIGIVAKYHKFGDTFQQQVGLSGFNIFVGLCTIIVGIVGLVAIINQYPFLIKVTVIASFVLGIIALVSLITALALSGNAVGYLHDSINDNMNNYDSDQDAADTINNLQTTYQCCGVNLWLDWARILLGSSFGRRRRRRHSSPSSISSLTRALRRKRQTIYNFPDSYGITLPFSCCTSGVVTTGDSLGGVCVFNASSDATNFYLDGCLVPVANIGLSQITGIAVINTCLAILAFVYFAKFITAFKNTNNPNNSNNGQQYQGEINQVQQQQQPYTSDPYYVDYSYPYPYYISDDLNYKTYM